MIKLTSELVPETAWYSNVRSNVSRSQWDTIRKQVYANANYVCEICGGKGKKHPVECHEVWEYDDTKHIQKLIRMIALCPSCHNVKHLGRAKAVGIFQEALAQLIKVNNWNRTKALKYTEKIFKEWTERSQHEWKLDITNLNKYIENIKRTGSNE